MAINLRPYQGVFGLPPPTSSISDDMIRNSMPVLEISPGEPNFSLGLSLFKINLSTGWKAYTEILGNHGFTVGSGASFGPGSKNDSPSGKPLKFAFIADNFPTDTFTNEYTETFLQKFTDVASGGLSQLIQMSGAKNFSGALTKYGGVLKEAGGELGEGVLGKIATGGAGILEKTGGELQKFKDVMSKSDSKIGQFMGGGAGLVDKMLAGHRIDFPQIWSNSGYSPSYSVTIRLYNPNPGNRNSTLKYIAGPIAVILCLSVPRTDNGASYRWPFYHKMRVRGLYQLNPAVITNVTIVKGGDQQQIAFNQTMGFVDVRIDFISLHKSMLLEEGDATTTDRPTVRTYIDEITADRGVITRAQMNNKNAASVGAPDTAQKVRPQTLSEFHKLQKDQAAAYRLPAVKEVEEEVIRVDGKDQKVEEEIITIYQGPEVYAERH